MRSVELFSGCGGLAYGLSHVGFQHELMVEWNKEAVSTVLHNRERKLLHVRDWPIQCADVRGVRWDSLSSNLDLLAGGPPCQPFSIGGKHRGQEDARDMWPEAIRAVREVRPRAFLFENVRGLARPMFSQYLDWILAHLRRPEITRDAGEDHLAHTHRLSSANRPISYEPLVVRVNAADFGAPQKRHRVIIAGLRTDSGIKLTQPEPTHSRERLLWEQWVTGEYWQRHSLSQPDDSKIAPVDLAVVKRLRARNLPPSGKPWVTVRDAFVGLGEPDGRNNHVLQPGARAYPGHTGSPFDQPAKAVKAGDHGVPGGENMLVRADGTVRYFTIREAARLQGLPDSYEFPGSWSESMRQIGNAVPTQMSEALGQWISTFLSEPKVERAAA